MEHWLPYLLNLYRKVLELTKMSESEDKVFIPEVVDSGGAFRQRKDPREPRVRMGCAVAGLSYFFVFAAGLAIYIWTIDIAYRSAGILGAVLSVFLPVFAQIFWGVKFWMDTGTIFNPYCMVVIGYSFLTTLMKIGARFLFFGRR
jgi:hypothetical protein